MTRLRFDKSLYVGTAVDEAVKVFTRFAQFELSESDAAWVVQFSADGEARELRIGREVSNYALGLTVQARKEAA